MLSVLTRYRDFRRLFLAELVVFGADWFVMVPLIVLLDQVTGKAIWGGLALTVETGTVALLLPYAGTVADRLDRRRILIGTTLGALVAVGVLFGVRGPLAGPVALLGVGLLATAKAFYTPAANSAVPNLVDPEDLSSALAVSGATWGTMTVVGSSLGGVISAWSSPYTCFALVAAGLVGAGWSVAGIRRPTQEERTGPPRRAFAAIGEAVGYLGRERRLRALVTVKAAVGVGNGLLTAFLPLAVALGAGARGLGLMFAARGAGALFGPLVMRRVLARTSWLLPGLAISMSAYGLAYLGVAVSGYFPLALVGIFVAHFAGGSNWVMSNYAIQRIVPDTLRGRVNAADVMVAMLAVTASQLVVALFVDSVPPRVLVASCAVTTLAYAISWWTVNRRVSLEDKVAAPAAA